MLDHLDTLKEVLIKELYQLYDHYSDDGIYACSPWSMTSFCEWITSPYQPNAVFLMIRKIVHSICLKLNAGMQRNGVTVPSTVLITV